MPQKFLRSRRNFNAIRDDAAVSFKEGSQELCDAWHWCLQDALRHFFLTGFHLFQTTMLKERPNRSRWDAKVFATPAFTGTVFLQRNTEKASDEPRHIRLHISVAIAETNEVAVSQSAFSDQIAKQSR